MKALVKKLVPGFLVSWYHFLWAFFSALFCGFPSRKLTIVGITGTNGKTTTANLAAAILEEAGYKVAVASSIKFKIGEKEQENKLKMTMPGRGVLQKFLRDAVKAGCQHTIIEATSEGILQHRHRFIKWNTMVFTNLSPEHIERHGSFENYRAAKGEYFKVCRGVHIINLDDKNTEYFLQFSAKQKAGFSTLGGLTSQGGRTSLNWILEARDIKEHTEGLSFEVKGSLFNLCLIGKFNVYNALAAICIGLSQGVLLATCQKALAKVGGVPGRMEEVIPKPFRVVVDYAFTPNALEQVYKTLTHQHPNLTTQSLNHSTTKLVCVLGACGGGRDKWKRPVLGEIAAKHCKEIIVTNEDPYDEPPMEVINQVAEGAIKAGKQPIKILDRREAIRKALELAGPGDTVIITGKGCEPWICVENNKKIPWDDRKVVKEEYLKVISQNR